MIKLIKLFFSVFYSTLEEEMIKNKNKANTGIEIALGVAALVSAGTAVYSATQTPDLPKLPKPVDQTLAVTNETSSKTIGEEEVTTQSARKTARKGTKAFRIPLQAKSTGVVSGNGSGLNI